MAESNVSRPMSKWSGFVSPGGQTMSGVLSSVPTTIPGFVGDASVGGSGSLPAQTGGSSVSVNSGLGLASLAGIFVEVASIVILLAVVGLFIIVVVANRAAPDPSGRRPQSVYFFAVSFVTIIISIIGSAVVVSAVVRLIGNHSGSTNSIGRTVVLGALITIVGMALLITHLRRGLTLARADDQLVGPSRRVGQSYVSAVAFLSVLVLLVVTVISAYLVFALAGPGVFGSFGGRGPTVRYLVDAVYIGAVAGLVLRTHRNLVPPGLRIFNSDGGTGGPTQPMEVPQA